MEKKYIDVEAFNKKIGRITLADIVSPPPSTVQILNMLAEFPAADVQEIKHGKWIWYFSDHLQQYSTKECSLCHNVEIIGGCNSYCPNCGAMMDGGKDDEI